MLRSCLPATRLHTLKASMQTDLMLDPRFSKVPPGSAGSPRKPVRKTILSAPHPGSAEPDTPRMGAWDSVLLNLAK